MSNPLQPTTPPRFLGGLRPGVIDPSQRERVLVHPSASLQFATYDPLTGAGHVDPAVSLQDPHPNIPRRIVIESVPGIGNRWNFVPAARLAPGVQGEGAFPRFVVLCGDLVVCTQEQWDIYKLDPLYDCFVPAPPNIPMISRIGSVPESVSATSRKRRAPSPVSAQEYVPKPARKYRKTKKPKGKETASASTLESTSAAASIETHPPAGTKGRGKQKASVEEFPSVPTSWFTDFVHENVASTSTSATSVPAASDIPAQEQAPSAATSYMSWAPADPSTTNDASFAPSPEAVASQAMEDSSTFAPGPSYVPPANGAVPAAVSEAAGDGTFAQPPVTPRKQGVAREPSIIDLTMEDDFAEVTSTPTVTPAVKRSADDAEYPQKRARTQSVPPFDKKAAERHRERRQMQERERAQEKVKQQQRREQELWEDIFNSTGTAPSDKPQNTGSSPLLEARERFRASRAAAAAEEAAREQQDPVYRAEVERRRAQAEDERREQERLQRREQERQDRRARAVDQWSHGPWTEARAIERYAFLCQEFDALQFSDDLPADFEIVPWPVLTTPSWQRPDLICWQAVEAFFSAAKRMMGTSQYKEFVVSSHTRFHPDRWLARNILKSVEDSEMRQNMEQAVLIVAQALTPIWRQARTL